MSTPAPPAPASASPTPPQAATPSPAGHPTQPEDTVYPPQPASPELQGPPQDNAAVPPALAVRLRLSRRLWASLVEMEGPRRRRFAFFTFAGLAQIVAFIVVLAIAYKRPCDRPLGAYLYLLVARIAVAFPLSFWKSITVRPGGTNATPAQREQWARVRQWGSEESDQVIRWLSDTISLFSLVLFFLGNYWVIASSSSSPNSCRSTNPVLYKGALAALILQWMWTLEIILYFLLILFFLPFFLIGMRWFGLGQAKNEIGPLSKNVIEGLPKRLFVGTIADPSAPPAEADSSSLSPAAAYAHTTKLKSPASSSVSPAPASIASTSSAKKQWWRLWRRRGASGAEGVGAGKREKREKIEVGEFVPFPPGVEPIRLPESQSACSICLCEYDPPPLRTASAETRSAWKPADELLSVLPCEHAFHTACLKDWLAVSGRCPLCQRPVVEPRKGKKGAPTPTGGAGAGGVAGGAVGGAGAEQQV